MTIVAPTYVQNPSIEKSGTTHSVNSSITTFTKKYAMPNVSRMSGSAMNVTRGLRKTFARPSTAPASRSGPQRSIENPSKIQSATISARTLIPHWTRATTTQGMRGSLHRWPDGLRRLSEELLELEGGAHVALDLQLARHVRRRRVRLALGDLDERLLARRDRAVGLAGALGDLD